MHALVRLLNPPGRPPRRVRKAALLLGVCLLMLYPNPVRLWRHVARLLEPSAMIEPDHPRLSALALEVDREVPDRHADAASVLRCVERVVYQRLPYKFDWDNWGCANYIPTVDEVLDRGCSDCKGRAVVAASLLVRRGVPARLVSDLSHMWVWTPGGETMSPVRTASGRKVLSASERGSRIDPLALLSPSGLVADIPNRVGFAMAIYPTWRVVVMLVAFWLVLLRITPNWRWALLGAWAMLGGLVCFKASCLNIREPLLTGAWAGIVLIGIGAWMSRRRGESAPG